MGYEVESKCDYADDADDVADAADTDDADDANDDADGEDDRYGNNVPRGTEPRQNCL